MNNDLWHIAESIVVLSEKTFAQQGKKHGLGKSRVGDHAKPNGSKSSLLIKRLEKHLYADFYCRRNDSLEWESDAISQRDHMMALSAANTGQGTWEPGWKIVSIEPEEKLAVKRDRLVFLAKRDEIRTKSKKVKKGQFCQVRIAKEMRHLVPGFYWIVGNVSMADSRNRPAPLLRFYWNLSPVAAITYIELVSKRMNEAKIPFRAKVISDPGSYGRADSGVLYLERRYFSGARPILSEIHRSLQGSLRPETPLFTKKLAGGLGFAEDPGNGLSYGQSRCRIIARALWDSFNLKRDSVALRYQQIHKSFSRMGLDPERPYLNAKSRDIFDLDIPRPTLN